MAALCETQEALQLSGVVHNKAFCTETHDEDAMSVESPNTSSVETSDTSSVETPDTSSVETPEISSVETPAPDTSSVETPEISSVETPAMSSVETQEQLELSGVVNSRAFYTETHDEDAMSVESPNTSSVETSDTSSVETPDTSSVETSEISSVETPAPDTSSVETPEISSVETPAPDTSSVETPEISSVETPAPETSPVEAETSDISLVETSSVEAQDTSLVETQEEQLLEGPAQCMVYCKETRSLLICDSYSWTIEEFSLSSSSGLFLQPQKLWNLHEMHSICNPISVTIARQMSRMFIGCSSGVGIYVLDQNSLQLVKKFGENMNRDFDYVVVDETEHLERYTVYASSTNDGKLTKFDYSSGSVMREISVKFPNNLLLKDNKLYLMCEIEYILVIDKHLEIQRKFALSGWSSLGGLCLDERGYICVTARNDSNHRILYSFDAGFNVVGSVHFAEFDEGTYVLDMVAADKDFIMLTQELDWEFTVKRIRMKL